MTPRLELAALDSLTVRLFEQIDEDNLAWLLAAARRMREVFGEHLVELVPSYTTLLVQFDLQQLSASQALVLARKALHELQPDAGLSGTRHVLPVWYHPSVGPDLVPLAARLGLTPAELIARHSGQDYRVFALGFSPGFAFMGLVHPSLAAPRLATPRPHVAAGSVGIAERQTAVYPSVSPGGWNLLGRTSARLFDRQRDALSLLQPGDSVRYHAIERDEFIRLGGDDRPWEAA
ncbi:MAG: Kinase A inhibitor [Pseudomonas citronellolis]|nr:MAG: Kinase A inhibitor [Pseudomonas citronellolis]